MQTVGIFGDYVVGEVIEQKRFFLRKEERGADGSLEVRHIPMRKHKKTLQLRHKGGEIVCFQSYIHRGQIRFKDSRERNKSHESDTHVVSELQRMLSVDSDKAKQLISLF